MKKPELTIDNIHQFKDHKDYVRINYRSYFGGKATLVLFLLGALIGGIAAFIAGFITGASL